MASREYRGGLLRGSSEAPAHIRKETLSKPARKTGLWLLTTVVTVAVMLILGEILIGLASPSEYLYPRYQFSAEYGLIPFPNVVMVHGIPRKYEFHYTVNSMNSRGEVVVPHRSGLPAVVVLGDSYSFGMGVPDGDEYPTIMRHRLSSRADVVNPGKLHGVLRRPGNVTTSKQLPDR